MKQQILFLIIFTILGVYSWKMMFQNHTFPSILDAFLESLFSFSRRSQYPCVQSQMNFWLIQLPTHSFSFWISCLVIQYFIVLFASRWRDSDCLLHHVVTWTLRLGPAGPSPLSKFSLSPKMSTGKNINALALNLLVLYGFRLCVLGQPKPRVFFVFE